MTNPITLVWLAPKQEQVERQVSTSALRRVNQTNLAGVWAPGLTWELLWRRLGRPA